MGEVAERYIKTLLDSEANAAEDIAAANASDGDIAAANAEDIADDESVKLTVGDKVTCEYFGRSDSAHATWYGAKIQEVNPDGTYMVAWNDGDNADRAKTRRQIRLELKVGDGVKCEYLGRSGIAHSSWYAAKILEVNSNNTYTVVWNDGDVVDRVKSRRQIRLVERGADGGGVEDLEKKVNAAEAIAKKTNAAQDIAAANAAEDIADDESVEVTVGDKAMCEYFGRSDSAHKTWYGAKIQEVNPDGTYLVAWNDGDKVDRTKTRRQIRLELKVGDKVKCDCGSAHSSWLGAKIQQVHSDETYTVVWNDGDVLLDRVKSRRQIRLVERGADGRGGDKNANAA